MEKQLKDYVGFYKGCKCMIEVSGSLTIYGTICRIYDDIDNVGIRRNDESTYYSNGGNDYKLILRPLSDMTPDEQAEHHRLLQDSIYTSKQEALRTAYLCSIGIDVFGLIDAGLAVDAKTVQS